MAEITGYESESIDKLPNDLFSGRLPLEQALQTLRTRLLDLSSRNRLLDYKHPKRRSIQFVDEPNLNLVFDRLIDGKSLLVKYIPDPPPILHTIKRQDAKTYAQSIGINTATEFSSASCGSSVNKHTPKLQALYYPVDLDKLCRKLSSEARTIIEETGTNMLHMVFGFLEFYEREDSDKPMLAPLLAVPVTLEKGTIDHDTRTYQYSIVYSGEDVHTNQTLREKLNRDFLFQLPEFEEEDEPSTYFEKIQQAVQKIKRWKVRYQLTLGFLSFGKLAIWEDLDPKKWPGLLNHPLLKEVFSGGSSGGANLFPEDYDIDKHPQADLPLIYDADSSQHSAIIDVMAGKNIVINGPPGTGKSQTITNIIAASLKSGKKILFVSEKLAALEVVRDRLNRAHLGHFCLELHSHKTQKKKLLSDLQERLDEHFYPPQQLQDKLVTLQRHKKDLNRYAELMGSRVGNGLGLTVYEVFWKTESRRRTIGDLTNAVQALFLPEASEWSYDDIQFRRVKLEALGKLYVDIGSFDSTHPWWGFTPRPLAPGDEEAIKYIIMEACSLAEELTDSVSDYQHKTGDAEEPSLIALNHLHKALYHLPDPPNNLKGGLLPRVFSAQDPLGKRGREILMGVIATVQRARELSTKANSVLTPGCELDYDSTKSFVATCLKEIALSSLSVPLNNLEAFVLTAEHALRQFERAVSQTTYSFLPIQQATLTKLDAEIKKTARVNLLNQSIQSIKNGASLLSREVIRLQQSLDRVTNLTTRCGIPFDSSLDAISHLGHPDCIEEVLTEARVNDSVVARARQIAEYPLSDFPLVELNRRQQELHVLQDRLARAFNEIARDAKQLGLSFDGTPKAVQQLTVLGHIAAQAPSDLLDYRRPSFAHPRALELLTAVEQAHTEEKSHREHLADEFYLDALPDIDELKALIRVFRRGDRLFNVFNSEWRTAKKRFNNICKTKTKRKATDYELQVSRLISWIEHRASFVDNKDYKETFGPLFKGIDTDFTKIHRLHDWYTESQTELLKHPGVIESVDLSGLDSHKVRQLAALAPRLHAISTELESCRSQAKQLLGSVSVQLEVALQDSGWADYEKKMLHAAEELKNITEFLGRYVKQDISPKRAVEVLKAKLDILSASSDLEVLKRGLETLHKSLEPLLPGITSIPCRRWSDYLPTLSNLAHAINSLVEFVSAYSDGKGTLSDIRTIFETKLVLETALEKFAALPEQSVASDWASYIAGATRRIQAGRKLVQLLKPVSVIGKTANEVVDGLGARKEADDLIIGLSKDAAVSILLQGWFQGIETDLDSLTATLSWGESIAANKLLQSSSLNTRLLGAEASANFYWAKQRLQQVTDFQEKLRRKLGELIQFGTFSWSAWNAAGHEQPKDKFASSLLERIGSATHNIDTVLSWSKYNSERVECKKIGLDDFVLGLEQKKLPPASTGAVFEFIVYRSISRSIYKSFPELEGFSGATHEKRRTEFITLDQELIGLTGKSFAYEIDKAKKIPAGVAGYRASERTELQLLLHELGKQRRHLPIRQLIKRAGRAIQALKPCFMMGPLSVAQYLEQGAVNFDMVVMDEASQLRPEEALGAIARGKKVIVVGDPKQLPPTNFFNRLLDDSDDEEDGDTPAVLTGSESILDICQQLFHPVRTLRWHYRSQHESLIEFSNYHFYNGKLMVFPSPFVRNNRLGLRYRYIKNGSYKDRQNLPEAIRVVDAILEHAIRYPEESLGVVTLNQSQRDLIEELLDKKLRNIGEAQIFVSKWEEKGWPFFVKNLENVQGDERDVIFISTTFGKAPGTDKPRQNFGPISRPDGWRRLNVLFTRARRKIDLFTSMLPEDIVADAGTPTGTKALRDYLDFAKRGVLTSTTISGREPDSDFEIAVGDMLRTRGYEVVPQLGVAGFFIDLAVRNPDRPGEFLAAVECDGAAYHSSHSARDRDRIRQAILESVGWKNRIWRIWSTDWFYDPRRASERLLAFLEERRLASSLEPVQDYDIEDSSEAVENVEQTTPANVMDVAIDPTLSGSDEDLYVEVGDQVLYCYVDKLEEHLSATIVDTESKPQLNLLNEKAPLAQALLNSAVGDELELKVKGGPTRVIRILRIHRPNNHALNFTNNLLH